MNPDDYNDRLVDLLLWESVGKETPPDVRARVLGAVNEAPAPATAWRGQTPRLTSLKSSRRSKAPAFAIAAILTLLAVAGALVHFQRVSTARTPVLAKFSGTINRSGGPIPAGGSLSTGPISSAVLNYQDGTVVELGPDTTIRVAQRSPWDRSKGIELVSGGVKAEVSTQIKGRPMTFQSSDAHAEVVGTSLSFHQNDDRTRLEVTKGAVHFTPRNAGSKVLVELGHFAEAGKTGFRHEPIPVPGITRFTLMNADSDQPIREEALTNGETISLSSLPTRNINIRADYEGTPPAFLNINLTRHDGEPTGLPPHMSNDQKHPPFFVAGDHWGEGRPNDCGAWTPRPGRYRLTAEAFYTDERRENPGSPLRIDLRINE